MPDYCEYMVVANCCEYLQCTLLGCSVVSIQVYDASAPFDANAIPQPSPVEVSESPVMPGYEYEMAPDVPTCLELLDAFVDDADQYDRVCEEGEVICTCIPGPPPEYDKEEGEESVEGEELLEEEETEGEEEEEEEEEEHYYGPVSFERKRYPYGDFGYPYDPDAAAAEVAEEEAARARAAADVLSHELDEDETALIADIMGQPQEDKAQYTVTITILY